MIEFIVSCKLTKILILKVQNIKFVTRSNTYNSVVLEWSIQIMEITVQVDL